MLYVDELAMELTSSYKIKKKTTKGKDKYEDYCDRIGGLKIDGCGIPIDKVGELVEALEGCFEHDPLEVTIKMKSQTY